MHASDFTDFTDHMHVSSTRALDICLYEGAEYIVAFIVVYSGIYSFSVRALSSIYQGPHTATVLYV